MTIDFATSFYFHREGLGLLAGMSDPAEPPGFSTHVDDAFLEPLAAAADVRAPAVLDAGIAHRWAGLYEVTPDHNALLGEVARRCRGSSTPAGSPATASCRARRSARSCATSSWATSRSSTSRPLDVGRFAAGAERPETYVV